jgi:transcriptional regulator with XRE-family HTH domain
MIGNPSFATVIRDRRRQLDLTQEEVARRIGTSVPYIGHLEAAKRHPSEKIVIKLATVLGLEPRELYLTANPEIGPLISHGEKADEGSAWTTFAGDRNLRNIHNITEKEMQILSEVAMMGDVRSPRDFIFILNTIRHALGR